MQCIWTDLVSSLLAFGERISASIPPTMVLQLESEKKSTEAVGVTRGNPGGCLRRTAGQAGSDPSWRNASRTCAHAWAFSLHSAWLIVVGRARPPRWVPEGAEKRALPRREAPVKRQVGVYAACQHPPDLLYIWVLWPVVGGGGRSASARDGLQQEPVAHFVLHGGVAGVALHVDVVREPKGPGQVEECALSLPCSASRDFDGAGPVGAVSRFFEDASSSLNVCFTVIEASTPMTRRGRAPHFQ
ncbi:uncharacterized protein PG986_008505 [Apiospora aurea]|uniref:Uncharacterized protein n=1 Tax=Apiospora aurea TaxID=335848 RepID=A0ABR1QFN5_9PEZI